MLSAIFRRSSRNAPGRWSSNRSLEGIIVTATKRSSFRSLTLNTTPMPPRASSSWSSYRPARDAAAARLTFHRSSLSKTWAKSLRIEARSPAEDSSLACLIEISHPLPVCCLESSRDAKNPDIDPAPTSVTPRRSIVLPGVENTNCLVRAGVPDRAEFSISLVNLAGTSTTVCWRSAVLLLRPVSHSLELSWSPTCHAEVPAPCL